MPEKEAVMDADESIRRALMELASERGSTSTFCPSEAAKRVAKDWRPLMPRVQEVAAALMEKGLLACTQRGQPAHPLKTRGAIRLKAAD
ncbi:MAG: DUF3253 domain-containing protein [Prosthecobacter sp.]